MSIKFNPFPSIDDENVVSLRQLRKDVFDILKHKQMGHEKVHIYYTNSKFFMDILGIDVFAYPQRITVNNTINLNEVTQEHINILLEYLDYLKITGEQ